MGPCQWPQGRTPLGLDKDWVCFVQVSHASERLRAQHLTQNEPSFLTPKDPCSEFVGVLPPVENALVGGTRELGVRLIPSSQGFVFSV